jgi:hypothetical protein
MRLLGLYRETEYSPGRHQSNDALLLEQVAARLRASGFSVDLTTIDRVRSKRHPVALVFSMCQGRAALELLSSWEDDGLLIVNSPAASLNTYRERLSSLMLEARVRFPSTRFVATREADHSAIDLNGGLWLKRGDVHAAVSADVQWIDSGDRLRAALGEFASRGIEHAALQRHQPGDEIKFYGVTGQRFFHWLYADESAGGSSRATASNRRPPTVGRGTPFDIGRLRQLAEEAAGVAGLDVFGGDAIVGPSGELTLIDLNDWPSFAPCRDRASEAIADYLMRRVDAPWRSGLFPSPNESTV